MTFFTFLRFTKQQICSHNRSPHKLKEATVGTKTLKAQPYLELKRIYTAGSNSHSNELLLLDAFRRVLVQIHAERQRRSKQPGVFPRQ